MRTKFEEQEGIDFVISLVYERTHIRLHQGKEPLIRARLGKRQRALGFNGLADYAQYLRDSGDEEEVTHAIDALTTNFTNFLREEEHFRFMVETALPELVGKVPCPLRIWSAACSTGEEPYSIAFYLEEHYPSSAGWDWRILATDVSTRALDKAKRAVFAEERIDPIPQAWQRKYLQRGFGPAKGLYRVKSSLCSRVVFRHENLLAEDSTGKDQYQVIFCRNVMIYFDRATQEKLVRHLCRFLVPKGYLLIGHSESLTGMALPLRCLRPSFYQLR
jgi:chemotaxis protein methyltransferase CheR